MAAAKHIEAINLLLEGMVTTGQSYQYISQYERAGITPEFPGNGFDRNLQVLKELTQETEAGYKQLIGQLGSIPVRLKFGSDKETSAEIVELTNFEDGRWHYRYKIGDTVADTVHSSTSHDLRRAVWAAILPGSEDLPTEQL